MQLIDIPNFEKVAGAEVAVGVRRGVVRIEVEQPIVGVVVVVATNIQRVSVAVRVRMRTNLSSACSVPYLR